MTQHQPGTCSVQRPCTNAGIMLDHAVPPSATPVQIYPTPCHNGGGGPRVVVSTAAFHARVRGSVPGLGGLKETKMFLPHPRVKVSIVGSLRDREVACSASDHQGSNFESCVWRTVSSQSSHHPQEVLLAQFSLYVHKGDLKPDSFHLPQRVVHQERDSPRISNETPIIIAKWNVGLILPGSIWSWSSVIQSRNSNHIVIVRFH